MIPFLSCVNTRERYVLEHVSENLFFFELPANREKMTNHCAGSYRIIVGEIGKSSCEHGKEQKFRRTWYPLSCKHTLCSLKKQTGDGSQ